MKRKKLMKKNIALILVMIFTVITVISGCSSDTNVKESGEPGNEVVEESEHQGENGEGVEGSETNEGSENGEGGEESGNTFALSETYDVVRKGARLVMNYDEANNTFNGIVTNTTNSTLPKVRVEVHLSNGIELGPTTPIDLAPGEKTNVTLQGTQNAFDGWTPHAEVGGSEHGSGSEGSEGHEGSEGSEGNE